MIRRAAAIGWMMGALWAGTALADGLSDTYDAGFRLFREERYEEALPYFEEALALAEARFGPSDPGLSVELNNLAEVLRHLGRYDEAEPYYKRALALDESSKGKDEPGLATSLNNLALLYRGQGRYDEAEDLYKRSLDLLERSLGPRDPKVAKTLNNLAVLYQAKGEPKAAMPLIERAAAVAGEALGPNNPTTETLKRNRETLARLIATKSPAPAAPPRTSIVAAMLPAGDAKARAPEPAASGHAPAPVRQAAVSSGAPSSAPSSAQDDGLGPYALHLASVRTAADTEGEWRRLAKLHGLRPDLVARPPERVEIAGKGVFYRVLRGAYATKAEAEGACAVVEAKGAYCTVRKLR
ncbi:MAG: tetratricopeptide repeat protein [Geminicoccaceae bacterium]|nr:tetratricopeptide repeat protein [Geminicoccaceae bacterium]